MKCSCGKQASVMPSYTEREYCDRCFLRYIEKRVRKSIRMETSIEPLDTVYVLNDSSKEFLLAKHFLEKVFGNNLTVRETKTRKIPKRGKLVIPTNMERELSKNLRQFLEKIDKGEKNGVRILDNVLEEEIVEICRILGSEAELEEKTNPLIEKMEARYPGTKFALHNSFRQLQEYS